jgi:hypothetical protein
MHQFAYFRAPMSHRGVSLDLALDAISPPVKTAALEASRILRSVSIRHALECARECRVFSCQEIDRDAGADLGAIREYLSASDPSLVSRLDYVLSRS